MRKCILVFLIVSLLISLGAFNVFPQETEFVDDPFETTIDAEQMRKDRQKKEETPSLKLAPIEKLITRGKQVFSINPFAEGIYAKGFDASGDVYVKFSDVEISADRVRKEPFSYVVVAEGNVTLKRSRERIECEKLYYNILTEQGRADDVDSFYDNYYVFGKRIVRAAEDEGRLEDGSVTTCDLSLPHYRMKARKTLIYLDDKIMMRDAVLYIGKLPVFFFPLFISDLKDRRAFIEIRPGYDSVDGYFVKTKYNFFTGPDGKGYIGMDFLENRGVARTFDYKYDHRDTDKGSIYTYYLRDKLTEKVRKKTRWEHTKKFNRSLSAIAKIDYISDQSFNDDLSSSYSSSYGQASRRGYISITQKLATYGTARMTWDRTDKWYTDDDRAEFRKDSELLPTLTLSMSRLKLGGTPLYLGASTSITNAYQKGSNVFSDDDDSFTLTSTWRPTLSHTLKLDRSSTLTTSIAYQMKTSRYHSYTDYETFRETYPDLDVSTKYEDTVSGSFRLYNKFTRELDLTSTYSIGRNLYSASGLNEGLSSNNLTESIRFRPISQATLTVSSGYDFLRKQKTIIDDLGSTRTIVDENGEWKDINASLSVRPASGISLRTTYRYDLEEREHGTFKNVVSYSKRLSPTFLGSFSWSHEVRRNSTYDRNDTIWTFKPKLEMKLGSKWTARMTALFDETSPKFQERELILYRDLHCWAMQMSYRERHVSYGLRREIVFSLNIKAFPQQKISFSGSESNEDWQWENVF